MRFWDRATSEAIGDKKQKRVRANLTNNQVSSPSRVFGQRPPFSNPLNSESYEELPKQSLGREVRRPDVEPIDETSGNSNDTLLGTTSAAGAGGTGHSTINVSGNPTKAEITSAFGTPAAAGAGFIGTIDDANFHTAVFICVSDGVLNWHWNRCTKAT